MSRDNTKQALEFDDLDLSTEQLPLIDARDDYEVICIGCRRTQKFRRQVLAFTFQIVSQCKWFGVMLPTYVNLPGKGRNVPPRSKLASWLRVINAFDPSVNLKRLSLKTFGAYQYQATVVTVTVDRCQEPLPMHERYSKIGDITAVIGRIKNI